MKAWEAGEAAARWTEEYAWTARGLAGAYLSGSFLTASRETEWPESSDVDVTLVFAPGLCPKKLGKFRESGVLLEASCLEETELASLEHVLSTHYLAFSMNAGKILYDPHGKLSRLHEETARRYAEYPWVEARCQSFLRRIWENLSRFDFEAPLPQQATAWAFSAGIACFPILAAALENCTVRKRYTAARQVLERYGMESFYAGLLGLLVPAPVTRERLFAHLEELAETFRLASETSGPSVDYAFRADISAEGAAVAIGGSRELIASAWPEEAVFWMLATFARCHTVLSMDEPGLERERRPAFLRFLRDLGIEREADFRDRLACLAAFLPELETAFAEVVRRRETGKWKR